MKERNVKDSMSSQVVKIRREQTLAEARRIMDDHHVRHLAVTDDRGEIIGVLSRGDVDHPALSAATPSGEAMGRPLVIVSQGLSLQEAARKMLDEKTPSLLVTDDVNSAVGIVSGEDMLKTLVALLDKPGELTKASYSPLLGELLREAQAAGL